VSDINEIETTHAQRLWREGEAAAACKSATRWAEAYARAITAVLANLQQFATLDELVEAWYTGRADAALDVVRHTASGHELNVGIIEDASFWRRWQQTRIQAHEKRRKH
jgi:hypothetical protein